MLDMNAWMTQFLQTLDAQFGPRVWFAGLQGSRGRGEATETSDIDVVVILDTLDAADVRAYRAMLDTLPHRALICGFLSGREELLHWDASDLFQFYHDTTPLRGSLDALLPLLDDAAVARAIHSGACSIYHGCVHNMAHEQSSEALTGLYKAASFVVQAVCFRAAGRYCRRQEELLTIAAPADRQIIETSRLLRQGGAVDFDTMSEALLQWAKSHILN